MPSLYEIEKAYCTLWMNQEARLWLRSGRKGKLPESVKAIAPAILENLDEKGASVYAGTINWEHHNMADTIFPYCAKAVGEDWDLVVVDYYKNYPSDHFNFNKICRHFPEYLLKKRQDLIKKYPYLAELAHYEWLELEKFEDESEIKRGDKIPIEGLAEINVYCPLVNPTLSICRYEYPIAEISDNFENKKRPKKRFGKKACIMAIYRDAETHHTRFIELGEASAAIIEEAARQETSYIDLLKLTLSLTAELAPESATLEFLNLIDELQNDNIFVGSKMKGEKNAI